MSIAIWIIAICEVLRAVQNAIQLKRMTGEDYTRAVDAFIDSLERDITLNEMWEGENDDRG